MYGALPQSMSEDSWSRVERPKSVSLTTTRRVGVDEDGRDNAWEDDAAMVSDGRREADGRRGVDGLKSFVAEGVEVDSVTIKFSGFMSRWNTLWA